MFTSVCVTGSIAEGGARNVNDWILTLQTLFENGTFDNDPAHEARLQIKLCFVQNGIYMSHLSGSDVPLSPPLRVGANEVLRLHGTKPNACTISFSITESHFKSGWRWQSISAVWKIPVLETMRKSNAGKRQGNPAPIIKRFNDGDLNGVRQKFEEFHPWD